MTQHPAHRLAYSFTTFVLYFFLMHICFGSTQTNHVSLLTPCYKYVHRMRCTPHQQQMQLCSSPNLHQQSPKDQPSCTRIEAHQQSPLDNTESQQNQTNDQHQQIQPGDQHTQIEHKTYKKPHEGLQDQPPASNIAAAARTMDQKRRDTGATHLLTPPASSPPVHKICPDHYSEASTPSKRQCQHANTSSYSQSNARACSAIDKQISITSNPNNPHLLIDTCYLLCRFRNSRTPPATTLHQPHSRTKEYCNKGKMRIRSRTTGKRHALPMWLQIIYRIPQVEAHSNRKSAWPKACLTTRNKKIKRRQRIHQMQQQESLMRDTTGQQGAAVKTKASGTATTYASNSVCNSTDHQEPSFCKNSNSPPVHKTDATAATTGTPSPKYSQHQNYDLEPKSKIVKTSVYSTLTSSLSKPNPDHARAVQPRLSTTSVPDSHDHSHVTTWPPSLDSDTCNYVISSRKNSMGLAKPNIKRTRKARNRQATHLPWKLPVQLGKPRTSRSISLHSITKNTADRLTEPGHQGSGMASPRTQPQTRKKAPPPGEELQLQSGNKNLATKTCGVNKIPRATHEVHHQELSPPRPNAEKTASPNFRSCQCKRHCHNYKEAWILQTLHFYLAQNPLSHCLSAAAKCCWSTCSPLRCSSLSVLTSATHQPKLNYSASLIGNAE